MRPAIFKQEKIFIVAEQNLEEVAVDLQKKLAEQLEVSASLQQALDNSKEESKMHAEGRTEVANAFAELVEKHDVVLAENEALKKRIAELQTVADKYEAPSFEFEGSRYELKVQRTIIPGVGEVTASDIVATPELQERLVKSGSGLIHKKV